MGEIPIITEADLSRLRGRGDVDGTDMGKILTVQKDYVTADVFPGEKVYGRLVRVLRVAGKKTVGTDEPSERVDSESIETLIALEDSKKWSTGLHVDPYILTSANEQRDSLISHSGSDFLRV